METGIETVTIDGKQYEVTGHAEDGLPIIQGHATSIHHKDEAGNPVFDADGNPKVSVHVSVSPAAEPIKSEKENK